MVNRRTLYHCFVLQMSLKAENLTTSAHMFPQRQTSMINECGHQIELFIKLN